MSSTQYTVVDVLGALAASELRRGPFDVVVRRRGWNQGLEQAPEQHPMREVGGQHRTPRRGTPEAVTDEVRLSVASLDDWRAEYAVDGTDVVVTGAETAAGNDEPGFAWHDTWHAFWDRRVVEMVQPALLVSFGTGYSVDAPDADGLAVLTGRGRDWPIYPYGGWARAGATFRLGVDVALGLVRHATLTVGGDVVADYRVLSFQQHDD